MKLLVLMSIEEYAEHLRKIFSEHKIPAFSESEVRGYKHFDHGNKGDDWFPHRPVGLYSHIVFSFVDDAKADEVLDGIEKFSKECDCNNPIRGFTLNVDKAV